MLLLAWRCHIHVTTSRIIEQMWECKKMCKIKKPKQKVCHEILEEPIGGSTKSRKTTYQFLSQEDEWRQWIKLACASQLYFEMWCWSRWEFVEARCPFKRSSPFLTWYASCDRRGAQELDIPLAICLLRWFICLLGCGGPFILFLVFPLFGGALV